MSSDLVLEPDAAIPNLVGFNPDTLYLLFQLLLQVLYAMHQIFYTFTHRSILPVRSRCLQLTGFHLIIHVICLVGEGD
jgi:hypothetical protein